MRKILFSLALILSCFVISAQSYLITTTAGTGTFGYSGNGGAATLAQLMNPSSVAADAAGNLYIADNGSNTIRKITAGTGIITTLTGNTVQGFSGDGGQASAAQINHPASIAVSGSGAGATIYFSDAGNSRIRKIAMSTGIITTIAGNGSPHGGDNAAATSVGLSNPTGIALNGSTIYFSETNAGVIRQINASGIISTIAGTGGSGYSGDNGSALAASLNYPRGLAYDAVNSLLYIADVSNHRIRVMTIGGSISTFAGSFSYGYGGDGGAPTSAYLYNPQDVALDAAGNIFIADGTSRIREVSGGVINTIAGNGTAGYTGDGGAATSAEINTPYGVCTDGNGNIFLADFNGNTIRRLCVGSVITGQPAAVSVCNGDHAYFSITATLSPAYQWQVNTGSGFVNITNVSPYSGATKDTLYISNAGNSQNGYSYRCVVASTGCLNVNSNAVVLTVNPLPAVSVNSPTICMNSSGTLTAGGALSYSWSTGATGATIKPSPASTASYTVTGTDGHGCKNSATATVFVHNPSTPSLCLVTADSLSKFNIIMWDKTQNLDADSFLVYREVSTNIYKRIAAICHTALSEYIDTTRHIGPANGDPNITTYHYKLAVRDTCGNEGPMSPYHSTVYFVDNQNGSFNWNTYAVEGAANTPVTTFDLIRDDNNTGAWHVIGSAAGTSNVLNDPNYTLYKNTALWRVQAHGFNCTPTTRYGNPGGFQTTVGTGKSNVRNNLISPTTTGKPVIHANKSLIYAFPNPATNQLTVLTDLMPEYIELFMMNGKSIYYVKPVSEHTLIDLSPYDSGIYYLKIKTEDGSEHFIKILKQ